MLGSKISEFWPTLNRGLIRSWFLSVISEISMHRPQMETLLSRFCNNQSDNLFNSVKMGWIKSDLKGMNEHECFKLILWFLFSFEFSVKLCGCSWWQIVVLCLLSKWLVIIDELEELCSLRLVRCSTWAEEQSTHSTTLSLISHSVKNHKISFLSFWREDPKERNEKIMKKHYEQYRDIRNGNFFNQN